MAIINNITIKNVKGYGDPAVTLPIELKSNRINLLFAPNGTGKSSLAAAFRSLTNRALEVAKENKYHKDEALESSLSLNLDGNTLSADSRNNSISPNIQCSVINCATVVHTTQRNMGRFTNVSGYIDVEDIVIERAIPNVNSGYSITQIKRNFGGNSKILPNLSGDFNTPEFLLHIRQIWGPLDTFSNAQSRRQLVNDVLAHIQMLNGKADEVYAQIDENWLSTIEANSHYAEITNCLSNFYQNLSRKDKFLLFFQLKEHWVLNKPAIKAATAHAEYEARRREFDSNLLLLDTTWRNIHTEEHNGELVVRFPQADEISNGQRDLLTFIVSIIKFKIHLRTGKKYLLLIDEVFDYLDDANLIAAQYYLTTFLDISRDNLFLCILSHLNPFTFRSYVFSDKKLNPQYLRNTIPCATNEMKAFIAFREGLDHKNPGAQNDLYHKLSHDLFHYNPTHVDYSADILALKNDHNLRENWGKTDVLHGILISEVNKYLVGNSNYDPYAVAMALRLRVEKIMHDQLPPALQPGFVDMKMTKNKFDYSHINGVPVPDMLYIVSAIHNDADHLKYDVVTNQYIEKPMVYKLQNNVVTGIIKKIFGWNESPLGTDVID